MVHQQGYRVTPVYKDGRTERYANGQTYPDCSAPEWEKAIAVGVVLDGAILLDYDGNKAQGDITPLDALPPMMGLDSLPQPVQENTDGDSLHFLFRRPEGFQCKASNDGWLPHIDVKTGNQLMHLKPGKIVNDSELPRLAELPPAPPMLLDALASKSFDAAPRFRYAPRSQPLNLIRLLSCPIFAALFRTPCKLSVRNMNTYSGQHVIPI
tara:strand:+ start:2530 stop:3159 length:630 start_codon:yes stop_codon:yes gene_type:complete